MGNIGLPELVMIFLVLLLLFGGKRLPGLARGFAKSLREFRGALNETKEEIRKSEDIYNNKRKILYKYGYPRLEEISKSKYKMKINNNKKYILIAPSWGENSITNICLEEIVENLIFNNYTVIFRPHNMSLIKNKKTIKNL